MDFIRKNRQFIVGAIANLSSFNIGMTFGWTSPIGPKLYSNNSSDSPLTQPISPTSEEAGWISSILNLGGIIGLFIGQPLVDKIGRKWLLLISAINHILGFGFLLCANDLWMIYFGRFIHGISTAFVLIALPIYCGEISSDDCRGAIGSLLQLFISSGTLYVYALGPFISYWSLQIACIIMPIIFIVLFSFVPDTPHYYILKNERNNAITTLKYLRGHSDEVVAAELEKIEIYIEESLNNKGSFFDLIKIKGNLKALFITVSLISFQQLSGNVAVLFNSQQILSDAGSQLDPASATILIGGMQICASAITPFIVDKLGRRIILLVCSFIMSVGLFALGAAFYISSEDKEKSQNIGWLPVVALIIYIVFYSSSFGPLPWVYVSEMFPGKVKSLASLVVALMAFIAAFTVTSLYPVLNSIGPYIAFWFFGGVCLIAFVFVFCIVIETKGLSFQQIQDLLNGKHVQ